MSHGAKRGNRNRARARARLEPPPARHTPPQRTGTAKIRLIRMPAAYLMQRMFWVGIHHVARIHANASTKRCGRGRASKAMANMRGQCAHLTETTINKLAYGVSMATASGTRVTVRRRTHFRASDGAHTTSSHATSDYVMFTPACTCACTCQSAHVRVRACVRARQTCKQRVNRQFMCHHARR